MDLSAWLAARTLPSAQVGSFNAGLISFFSGRTTVNLDGVMNDNALEALRSGTLCDYIDAQRLDYLADNRLAIELSRRRSIVPQRTLAIQVADGASGRASDRRDLRSAAIRRPAAALTQGALSGRPPCRLKARTDGF